MKKDMKEYPIFPQKNYLLSISNENYLMRLLQIFTN